MSACTSTEAERATTVSGVPGSELRQSSARVGDLIAGKYLLLRPIAGGAMGTVWGARNMKLDLTVAIKIVHPHVKYPFVAPALLWEAQAACKLSHPAIVRVFDFGWLESGDPFIVMEHLVGETLRALLGREERLSPERAVKLMLPIADGLAAAHAEGIIHRDLKPENIVLVTDHAGRVRAKIIDFGVAKLSWVADDWVSFATVVGTPGYMPLEQASGQPTDERADVWAYAATLYELIAGLLPFRANGVKAALRSLETDAAPSLVIHGVDEELAHIVARGLERNAEDRWATMDCLREALAAWLASRQPPSASPRSLGFCREKPSRRPQALSRSPLFAAEATSLVLLLSKRIHRERVSSITGRHAPPRPKKAWFFGVPTPRGLGSPEQFGCRFRRAPRASFEVKSRERGRRPRARKLFKWVLVASVATATFFTLRAEKIGQRSSGRTEPGVPSMALFAN